MKRYGFELVQTGPQPEPYSPAPHEWELTESPKGEYVLYSDASSALTASEARVTEAYLAGALAMREKIARALETSPRKAIYECAPHVRLNIKPVSQKEAEQFLPEARALGDVTATKGEKE